MKPKFWLQNDFYSIINYNTFSVVPSIINQNTKNVLFHYSNQFLYLKFEYRILLQSLTRQSAM